EVVKPKKKIAGKKVAKKTLRKSEVEEETEQKSKEEVRKRIEDVNLEEKHAKEEVDEFKDEAEKVGSDDVDVTATVVPQLKEAIKTSPDDEATIIRRVRKRSSIFALPPDQEILAFRNDTVKIECEVFNQEDKINWLINGKPITDDKRCTEIMDGYLRILQIDKVVPEETGTIITANLREQSAESYLIIEDIPVEIIEKLPHKITGKMDDFVKLSITVSHPDQNFQWFFNNEQLIGNNNHYEIIVEDNVYSLLIKNLSYDQAGRYSVKVDSAETSTILTVEGAPILDEIETSVTAVDLETQDNLMLTIPFKAIPEPTLECFLNNEKIPSSSKIQIDIFNDKACFCKRKVDKSDAGEYTIKIKNDYGEVSQTFSVNIKDVPGAPENAHITDIDSSSARVRWNAPSDDGGSAITAYILEKKEASKRAYHRVAQVSSEEMEYYMDDLKMDTPYMIHIAAVNKYGIGEYLECDSFQTCLPFETPSVTHPPTIHNVTDQSCTLKWPKVTDDGGSPIYGYDIFLRKDKSDWIKINDELVFTEHFTVPNIETGPTYEFKVEATNEAGFTSQSNILSEPLTISKAAELPVLSLPTVEVINEDAVRVQWNEITDENCNVTSYVIMYKSEQASLWSEKEINHSPAEIIDLKEGLSYLFKIAPKSGPTIGEFSEETIPIRMAAAKKPEITKSIKDVSVSRKSELKLECHAIGEPAPQYIWYKDGQEIIPTSENIEIVNEGFISVLLIHHTSIADTGLYRCEVVNDLGSVDSEATVTVTEVRAHFVSSFPEYLEIDEGEEIGFSCELSDADASVIWFKDGKPLSSDDRIMIREDGIERKLTIKNTVPEDSGKYVCSTADNKTHSRAELIVKEELPQIKRGPQDQIVSESGITVVLTCEITKPVTAVKWFKNEKEIWSRQRKFSIDVKETIATLTIMDFELSDCAEYRAALREDEKSAPAKVELKIAPTIKLSKDLPNNVLKLHCGTDFDIEFIYGGFPEVDIKTTLNDKLLDKMRSRIHTYDNKLSLRLKNVIQEDSGILKVMVENEIGHASEEIQLDVINVPSKPLHLTAFNITSHSVMLKWEKAEDNGSPVTNYIIERRTADINRWRNVGKCKSKQYEFLADDLYPNESYSFRIVAVNEVGEGAPSSVVDIVTLNESTELAISTEETAKYLSVPNRAEATLVEDSQTILITWEIVEEAEDYIIERSKLENNWEQIGMTVEPKFEDSCDESSSYKYRIIAKKGDQLSSPSDETKILIVPVQKEKEVKQQGSDTTEMLQEVPEITEIKQKEMKEPKSEKSGDQDKKGKVGKKVAKKKEDKQELKISDDTVGVEKKAESKPKEEEIKTQEKEERKPKAGKKKPEKEQEEDIEVERKLEDELESSEKVEKSGGKVEPKKIVRKKALEKKEEAEKKEILKDEIEIAKDFKKKVKTEKQSEEELEKETEKHKIKSDKERLESVEKLDIEKGVGGTPEEKHLEKKSEAEPEKKTETEQKIELLETVKVEPKKDSGKKIEEKEKVEAKREVEKDAEDEISAMKKKTMNKQEPMEQKLKESISHETLANGETLEEKHLEKKSEAKPEKKTKAEQKIELLGTVKDEPKKDSGKKIEEKEKVEMKCDDQKIAEDEKSTRKKKTSSKQKPKEKMEQKLEKSISQETSLDELITEKGKEGDTIKKEKLEVKPVNDHVTVNYGTKNLELSINIKGNYEKCFWTKNDEIVNEKLVKSTTSNSVLRVENVDELTMGLYRYVATNSTEKATAEIHVVVTDKPKIEFNQLTIGVKVGEMLKIHANVTGLPVPTYKWLKDGTELKADENTIITFKEGIAVVIIKKATVDDSGVYKLIVENTCGKEEDEVKVQVKGVPSAPVGPLQISDITSDSCKLTWNPPEQDGNSKLLGYCIEKRDAKKSTWAFVARTTTTNATITGLTDFAKYYFRVAAENALGTGPALENKEPVQPIKVVATEKPKIKKAPEKGIGKVGDKLKLSVEFTGKPAPKVRWYKNGEQIFDNVDNTITETEKQSVLTIQKLIEDDEGDYQVVVENDCGAVQHKFSVAVKSKPVIIDADKYKKPQVFKKGENVKLQLAFTG
ncbi:unnamed protein product, partial [Onchocerca ochengi]